MQTSAETVVFVAKAIAITFIFFAMLKWGIEQILRFLSAVLFATADAYGVWRAAILRLIAATAADQTWIRSFRAASSREAVR